MVSGDENERPKTDESGSVRNKRRRSILDKNGRYIDRSPKKTPKPKPPKMKRDEPRITLRRRPASERRKEHDEAKKQHAATQAEIEMLRKRNKILALREQGATIRQISEQMKANGEEGCSEPSVFRHLVAALNDLTKNYTLNTKSWAQLRLNQMQRIELSHFKRLNDTHLTPNEFQALSRGMDIIWKRMDQMIAELTGEGKKQTKIEITADTPMPIEVTTRVIMPTVPETDVDEVGEEEEDAP